MCGFVAPVPLFGLPLCDVPPITRQTVGAEEGLDTPARVNKTLAMLGQRCSMGVALVQTALAVDRAQTVARAELGDTAVRQRNPFDLAQAVCIPIGDDVAFDDPTVVVDHAVMRGLSAYRRGFTVISFVFGGFGDQPQNSDARNGGGDIFTVCGGCGCGCKGKTESCGRCHCEAEDAVHGVYPFISDVWVSAVRTALDGINMGVGGVDAQYRHTDMS